MHAKGCLMIINPGSDEPAPGWHKAALGLWTVLLLTIGSAMADTTLLDDRSRNDLVTGQGQEWRLITDRVMGGVSEASLRASSLAGRDCLRLQGTVSLENNGGFVQMALEPAAGEEFDASQFRGLEIEVAGNGESYNLHLRTADLWFPWQSFRADFTATPQWRALRIPFADVQAYRHSSDFDASRLTRIGLVAIGRDFDADLCLGGIRFYR